MPPQREAPPHGELMEKCAYLRYQLGLPNMSLPDTAAATCRMIGLTDEVASLNLANTIDLAISVVGGYVGNGAQSHVPNGVPIAVAIVVSSTPPGAPVVAPEEAGALLPGANGGRPNATGTRRGPLRARLAALLHPAAAQPPPPANVGRQHVALARALAA